MSKFSKLLYSLFAFLLLLVLGLTALEFSKDVSLPSDVAGVIPEMSRTGFWGDMLSQSLFWGASFFAFLLLLLLLGILFYPRTYTEVELADGQMGRLLLKKSAVEGYVKTIVAETGYMSQPSVRVQIYRKRFKVRVAGNISPRVGVLEKTQQLQKEIQEGLNSFFGISKKVNFTVQVKHIEEKKKSTSRRVE